MKTRTVQPLLFGGYQSGPALMSSSLFSFFGVSVRSSSLSRRRLLGDFQRKVSPGCPKRDDDGRGCKSGFGVEGVEPGTTVCRDEEKPQGRPSRRAEAARIEAVVPVPSTMNPDAAPVVVERSLVRCCLCVKNSGPVKKFSHFHIWGLFRPKKRVLGFRQNAWAECLKI